MSDAFKEPPTVIRASEILVLESARATAVRVIAGTVWASDPRGNDYVAAAGETFYPEGDGKVIVSGLDGSATIAVDGDAVLPLAA